MTVKFENKCLGNAITPIESPPTLPWEAWNRLSLVEQIKFLSMMSWRNPYSGTTYNIPTEEREQFVKDILAFIGDNRK
jgi:hypothetical protein